MRRIRYAGDSVVTGDVIAAAVIDYSQALAQANTAASVDIPVRMGDGGVGSATLLVGPASQLITVPEPGDHVEIVDEELVASLKKRTEDLGPVQTVIAESDDVPVQTLDDLDYPTDDSE
jgi:hypothetical protein